MNRGRLAVVLAVDVAVWLVLVLVLTGPGLPAVRARGWHSAHVLCRSLAATLGAWSLAAEARYWEEVRA